MQQALHCLTLWICNMHAVLQAVGPSADLPEGDTAAALFLIMRVTQAGATLAAASGPSNPSAMDSISADIDQTFNQPTVSTAYSEPSSRQSNARRVLEAGLECMHAFQQLPKIGAGLQHNICKFVTALLPSLVRLPVPPFALALQVGTPFMIPAAPMKAAQYDSKMPFNLSVPTC